MSQDWVSNLYTTSTTGDTTLSNMELMFATLRSSFSGSSAPASPVPGQWWFDTTNNILKLRNEADTAWLDVWDLANDMAKDSDTVDGIHANTTATANQLLALDGSGQFPSSVFSGSTITRETLTSGTGATWNVPSDVSLVLVTVQGGGGGGGGSNSSTSNTGGGGASGELLWQRPYTVTPSGTVTYTIGGGGSGGGFRAAGSDGSDTVFGTLTARGGDGGSGTTGAGGSSQFVAVGGTSYGYRSGGSGPSEVGVNGQDSFAYAGGVSDGSSAGGGGGASEFGAGGAAGASANGSPASANTGAGGGGGGIFGNNQRTGGAGGSGVIEILYFSL